MGQSIASEWFPAESLTIASALSLVQFLGAPVPHSRAKATAPVRLNPTLTHERNGRILDAHTD